MYDRQHSKPRDKIFVSYSHKDKKYLDRLRTHFASLQRQGKVEFWDDTSIRPGKRWREEIQQALDESTVAVLMISADFLDSDFINEHELPQLLSAAERRGLTVLPVHIAPSDYKNTALAEIKAVNDPAETIAGMEWEKGEQIFLKVVQEARRILDETLASFDVKEYRASDQGLLGFPREILNKRRLTTLYLSGNKLTKLPDEFASLDKLKVLYLNRNQFEVFPEVVLKLPRLRELYFSDNQLIEIPSSIQKLNTLRMLRVSGNNLEHIPSELGRIISLKELYLANNKLEYLPSEIGLLKSLECLDVSNNALQTLPSELRKLTALRELKVHGNAFKGNRELEELTEDPKRLLELLLERNQAS